MKLKTLSFNRIIICSIAIAALILIAALFFIKYNKYTLISETKKVELGSQLSNDIKTYVKAGHKQSYDNSKLDLSLVDSNTVGEYDAYIIHNDKKYPFKIIVEDTTAPVITPNNYSDKILIGEDMPLSNLVSSISDLSTIKNIKVTENDTVLAKGTKLEDLKISEDSEGIHTIKVEAEDVYGNVGEELIHIRISNDTESSISESDDENSTIDESINERSKSQTIQPNNSYTPYYNNWNPSFNGGNSSNSGWHASSDDNKTPVEDENKPNNNEPQSTDVESPSTDVENSIDGNNSTPTDITPPVGEENQSPSEVTPPVSDPTVPSDASNNGDNTSIP